MENVIPTNVSKPKEEFKVIPVREVTRERLKNDMMKRDIYDSYINSKLDEVEKSKEENAELQRQLAAAIAKSEEGDIMSVKSQQDIKNATKVKEGQIPRFMENKFGNQPTKQQPVQNNKQPLTQTDQQSPIDKRLTGIEKYLTTVDQAFAKIVNELSQIQNIMRMMDNEMSKVTGDIVRLTKLEEDRYIELVSAINQTHDKVETLNEAIPTYIDKRIGEYFEELVAEDELPEDLKKQDDVKTP